MQAAAIAIDAAARELPTSPSTDCPAAVIDWLRRLYAPASETPDTALVLTGGGARGAYQAGVLRFIAEMHPEHPFSILNGVSAGAINTAFLANYPGTFAGSVEALIGCWKDIRTAHVFESESSMQLLLSLLRRGETAEGFQSVVETEPLRSYLRERLRAPDGRLAGVEQNLRAGWLKAFAVVTTSYTTGQTVTWVQGRGFDGWERPSRVGVRARLTVEHVMASTALPLLFPAVQVGSAWYGDGGVRLAAPLAPAVHLGADRILAISTRYHRNRSEADVPEIAGYPPVAQIASQLMKAVFLDALDQDAHQLHRINELLTRMPPWRRGRLRPIDLLLLRPSRDIGRLSGAYEHDLTGALNLLARVLGSRGTRSPDWLSMLLFDSDYVGHLIELGYEDARRQRQRIADFLMR